MTGWLRGWGLWSLPRPALLLVLAVHAAVVAVLAAVPHSAPTGRQWAFFAVAFAALLAGYAAERRVGSTGVYQGEHTISNQADAWMLAVVLVCPLWMAVLFPVAWYLVETVLGRLLATVPGRTDIAFKTLFNGSQWAVAAAAGGWLWAACGGAGLFAAGGWLGFAPAAALAGVAMGAVSGVLLVTVIVRAGGGALRRTVRGHLLDAQTTAPAMLLGVLAAGAWQTAPASVLFAFPLFAALQRSLLHRYLLDAARNDAKTGLPNAEFWRQTAEAQVARAAAGGPGLSLMVVDLDFFKAVNDTHGHLAGDDVLREVAVRLRKAVRPGDMVGRFGGEEFTVLLPGADPAAALLVAERVRRAVEAAPVRTGDNGTGPELSVTCSVGVASTPSGRGTSLADVMTAADQALYAAKHGGRNQVRAAA